MDAGKLNPREIAAAYDRFWEKVWNPPFDDWTRVGRRSLRMRALEEIPVTAGRILDLGCGNGLALSKLRDRGLEAVGCDVSRRALKDANACGSAVRADGTCLPFRSNSFTFILLLDALEHVIEKGLLLEECNRALAEGGRLILTTPHPRGSKGHGDHRQPYDKPVTYFEIAAMTEGLFSLQAAKAVFGVRGHGAIGSSLPARLFLQLPVLLEKASEVMLVFKKNGEGSGESGGDANVRSSLR